MGDSFRLWIGEDPSTYVDGVFNCVILRINIVIFSNNDYVDLLLASYNLNKGICAIINVLYY